MAGLRGCFRFGLIAVLALGWATPAHAQEETGLYDRPVLVLDPGVHTGGIWRADVDAAGRYAVTGSNDKTARVWSGKDGRLLRTIRLPAGPGDLGNIYAVAISPDGDLIAAGGRLGTTAMGDMIYIFDRATSAVAARIEDLPEVVLHLTFSLHGRYLAATLGSEGLRVYDRDAGWAEVARDTDYGNRSNGAVFAEDGRLATTSYDGKVRLYDRNFQLVAEAETTGGQQPFGIAFSSDDAKLAVGYFEATAVDLLDGHTLDPLPSPDTSAIDNGDLFAVAWSADGKTLFAGGRYARGDGVSPVVAWADAGAAARRELPAGTSTNTIMSIAPLEDGALLVAAADPYLARLDPDGGERWAQRPPQADLRGQYDTLAVSFDGQTVHFGYEIWGEAPARFDLASLDLSLDPQDDDNTAPPNHDGLPIEGWKNTYYPTLDGAPLWLDPYERSRSLAIHPNRDRFVLGTEWSLRAYDAKGEQLWRQDVPGVVSAVNISGDGRLVVAAYDDGTIRWHRMDDGKELLAFFPLADRKNWVAWTPEGAYTATQNARRILRWHVNRGWDAPGEAIPVSDIPEQHRPEVLPLVLQELDFVTALGIVEQTKMWNAVQRRTNSDVPPGSQLHVLAIGVGEYNEENAKHLRLKFADDDAWDVASALLNTQGSLYAKVNPQVLRNGDATRVGIFRALDTIQRTMLPDDVAVFHFSGHGALVGGALYLLPHEVDPRDGAAVKASAIEIGELRTELLRLAERGRVLVLLDACRSGAITQDGADTAVDASQLRAALASANVTVLTSSSGKQNSIEDEKWQNGAFTEVFLEALGREADSDRNSVVSMTELTRYVTAGVPRLVRQVRPEWEQTPGLEMRFEHTIFAAGL